MGFWLESEGERLGVPREALKELRALGLSRPRYALGAKSGSAMTASGWNVLVLIDVAERGFERLGMAPPIVQTLQRLAAETGYRLETLEKVLRLLELLDEPAQDSVASQRLALKRGTALNVGRECTLVLGLHDLMALFDRRTPLNLFRAAGHPEPSRRWLLASLACVSTQRWRHALQLGTESPITSRHKAQTGFAPPPTPRIAHGLCCPMSLVVPSPVGTTTVSLPHSIWSRRIPDA